MITQHTSIGLHTVNNVVGIDDIKQSIYVILTTRKGAVPFNPAFGSDIYSHLDRPVSEMVPAAKKAIIDAIDMFEPRVQVESILHRIVEHRVEFDILMTLTDSGGELLYTFAPYKAVSADIRLYTLVGTFRGQQRYFLTLEIDGVRYDGASYGFTNLLDAWGWVMENWCNLGQWYSLPSRDQLLLYVYANNANLKVTGLVGAQALFPPLSGDEFYIVRLGDNYSVEGMRSREEVLSWVRENWQNFGVWMMDDNYLILSTDMNNPDLEIFASDYGDFGEDFDNNFSIS